VISQIVSNNSTNDRRELARQFQTSEDAIDAMIGVWMRKGGYAKSLLVVVVVVAVVSAVKCTMNGNLKV